jgi:hypothetical protein
MKKFIIAFLFTLNVAFAETEREERVKIYTNENSIIKVLFNMAEITTFETKIPINVAIEERDIITQKILNGDKIDILITEDYSLLEELRDIGVLNFSFVSEIFYDRLTLVPLQTKDFSQPVIFFKTQKRDKDVFDNNANKLPSVFISAPNLCRKLNSVIELYSNSYEGIVVKESIAQKCDLPFQNAFDNLYSLYYIAIITGGNFANSKRVNDFFENSPKIKSVIRKNGYRS